MTSRLAWLAGAAVVVALLVCFTALGVMFGVAIWSRHWPIAGQVAMTCYVFVAWVTCVVGVLGVALAD